MTNENNAAQPVLTDDEILAATLYGQSEARMIRNGRAIESALLSKLRAPVAGEAQLPWHLPVQHWTDEEKAKLDAAPQASEAEQTIIAAFLERSGQWLTNDAIVKAARDAVLEEAAKVAESTAAGDASPDNPYRSGTAKQAAARIRALKSQSAALSAQPGAQRTGGSDA